MPLTDELIQATINNITGYIVANVAEQRNKTAEEIMSKFIRSKIYAMLSDKDTGLYWNSISETTDMFLAEIEDK